MPQSGRSAQRGGLSSLYGVSQAERSAIMSVTHYVALSLLVAAVTSTQPMPTGPAGLAPVQNSCQFSAGVGADRACGSEDNNNETSRPWFYPGWGVVVVPPGVDVGVGVGVGGAR
jgi:hypothetical protein